MPTRTEDFRVTVASQSILMVSHNLKMTWPDAPSMTAKVIDF